MPRPLQSSYESGITRFEERSPLFRRRRLLVLIALALAILWVGVPALRVAMLLWTNPFRSTPAPPAGLPVRPVRFPTADGVLLRGWLVPAAPNAAAVVLVPGFKSDRASMVPYARFLHAAGFTVLLYDSRGTGASAGAFGLGVREVDDVRGAVAYLAGRRDLTGRHVGLLGVSLGAGDVIVAAAGLPGVRAVVADSAYVDQTALVDRLDSLRIGPLAIPLAPIAPWLVDRALGQPLASFSPLRAAGRLAPRGLLLIHSRHDANPTTPLSGPLAIHRAAGSSSLLWIAPRGGHAGALAAQPGEYRRRVIAFLRSHL